MAVYVDELLATVPVKGRWPFRSACHLIADSISELHNFAARIGLKRAWFQEGSSLPHYDLTASKRKQAIKHGAIEIDGKTMAKMIRLNAYKPLDMYWRLELPDDTDGTKTEGRKKR